MLHQKLSQAVLLGLRSSPSLLGRRTLATTPEVPGTRFKLQGREKKVFWGILGVLAVVETAVWANGYMGVKGGVKDAEVKQL
ncbi:hypothetical protein T439DRAFT_376640 [Meredithblackwellia eburnea MCA 4105]